MVIIDIRIFVFVFLGLNACSDPNWRCNHAFETYREEWNLEVKKVNTEGNLNNSDYNIETTSGKTLSFRPFQNIIALAEPGDRLVKIRNTNWCYIISSEGDTLTSRIYSETCDRYIDSISR